MIEDTEFCVTFENVEDRDTFFFNKKLQGIIGASMHACTCAHTIYFKNSLSLLGSYFN